MADDLYGQAFWPGVHQILSASASNAHGITPCGINLDIVPQPADSIESHGDFVITDGKKTVTLKDCVLASATLAGGDSGDVVSLVILDRRWKWKFGGVAGEFNMREKDGKIVKGARAYQGQLGKAIEDTERTPRQLVQHCLAKMGEDPAEALLDDLPNEARPAVIWEFDNAAECAAKICEDLRCRIVLQHKDNKVAVRKLGEGEEMPDGLLMTGSQAFDPPEKPEILRCVTGRTKWQLDLELEAVGLDKDQKIKLLKDLSYNPGGVGSATGWDNTDPYGDFTEITDTKLRKLAKRSVFKWYRIKIPIAAASAIIQTADGPTVQEMKVDKLAQVLPISEALQVEMVEDEETGEKKNKRAILYGIWYNRQTGEMSNSATTLVPLASDEDKTVVPSWDIDGVHGIVKAGEGLAKFGTGGISKPADLRLRITVSIRNPENRSFWRFGKDKNIGGQAGLPPMIVKRDEIEPTFIAQYDNAFTITGMTDNQEEVNAQCDYYLEAAEREFKQHDPAEGTYTGIMDTELDGAIQSIEWTVNESGVFTRIARNRDLGTETVVPYKLRRANEKAKAAAEKTKEAPPKYPPTSGA